MSGVNLRSGKLALCAALAAGALFTTGCYTTTHVVNVTPLKTKYPVSASGQFLDESGAIVTEDGYTVVSAFDFNRQLEAPRHATTTTRLELEDELNRILSEKQGDAMTDVRIVATDYDPGSHGSAAGWKIMGWTFGLSGATLMAVGAGAEDATPLLAVGGVLLGVGVLSYALSGVTDDPAIWTVQVKGNVVKRSAPPLSVATENDNPPDLSGGLGVSGAAPAKATP